MCGLLSTVSHHIDKYQRKIVRFKKYCPNFDARRRIRHIRANATLALSSLAPQIMLSCAKNVSSRSVRK
jgi:hypothetical protein